MLLILLFYYVVLGSGYVDTYMGNLNILSECDVIVYIVEYAQMYCYMWLLRCVYHVKYTYHVNRM